MANDYFSFKQFTTKPLETIQNIKAKYKDKINIGCIVRNDKIIIPNNENIKLEVGDTVYVLANTVRMHKFLKKIKLIYTKRFSIQKQNKLKSA